MKRIGWRVTPAAYLGGGGRLGVARAVVCSSPQDQRAAGHPSPVACRKIETGFIMAATANRLVTFAELEPMPGAADGRYELRPGELVKVPPAEFPHFRIQHRLRKLLESVANADR